MRIEYKDKGRGTTIGVDVKELTIISAGQRYNVFLCPVESKRIHVRKSPDNLIVYPRDTNIIEIA